MKDLIQCGAPRVDFQRWLGCGNGPLGILSGKDGEIGVATLSKLPRTDDIDYLYSTAMEDNAISWDHGPVFIGVYNHQDQSLYLTLEFMRSDVLRNLIPPMDKNIATMDEVISTEVNRRVEDIIADARNNLSTAQLTDWQLLRSLGKYQEPDGKFHSQYKLEDFQESAFITYLTKPNDFIQGEAETYIAARQEDILLEHQTLMQDPNDPTHQMKAISDAEEEYCGQKADLSMDMMF